MRKTVTSEIVKRETVNKFLDKIIVPGNMVELPNVLQTQLKYEINRDRALVMVLYLSAARVSEILPLRKNDFDFSQKNSRLYEINMINLKNKNRDKKQIGFPADDSFSSEIKKYVKKLKKNMLLFPQRKMTFGYAENKYIDKPMSRTTAYRHIKKYDSKLWCHWFRHARLSNLSRQGLSDRQLTSISGHASSQMLQVYVNMSPTLYEDKIRGE